MSFDVAKRIAELGPWAEAFSFDGVQTVPPERYQQLDRRMLARRSIFLDPMVMSGALNGKRVLDLGCNAGYWSLAALEGGARIVKGVDTDRKRIDQAQFVLTQHGISADRYELLHSDVYGYLSSTDDEFDIVLCLGLFYDIEDPIRLMRLMHKVTRELVVIIDSVVHNIPQAAISVRPCPRKKRYLDVSNIGLENSFPLRKQFTGWLMRRDSHESPRWSTRAKDFQEPGNIYGAKDDRSWPREIV